MSPRQKGSKKAWHWQQTTFEFPKPARGRKPWVRWRDLQLKRTQKSSAPPILQQPLYFPYIGPKGSAGAELALLFERRGRYVQNAFGVSTRFPFSFLLKTRNVMLNRELIVYPKVEQTEEFYEMLPLITGEFENHIRGRGHDLYRIRDYQPEDSARHVDWKSSAKSGVLKIREFAREDEHRLRIVFDNAFPGLASAESYERGVSLTASLAFYLAEQNASLTFAAQGLAEPTLWGFLHHLALIRADGRAFSSRFAFAWGRLQPGAHLETARDGSHFSVAILLRSVSQFVKIHKNLVVIQSRLRAYTVPPQAAWGSHTRSATCDLHLRRAQQRARGPIHEHHS